MVDVSFAATDHSPQTADRSSAIKTYDGQGVAANDVVKSDHCIVYTGRSPPEPGSDERPRRQRDGRIEEGMQPIPIRVVPNDHTKTLDLMNRLDLTSVKLAFLGGRNRATMFGEVHRGSMSALMRQFQNVQASRRARMNEEGTAGQTASEASRAGPRVAQRSTASTLTPEQVRQAIIALELSAQQNGLMIPGFTEKHIKSFAESPEQFRAVLEKVKDVWRQEMKGRSNDDSGDDSG